MAKGVQEALNSHVVDHPEVGISAQMLLTIRQLKLLKLPEKPSSNITLNLCPHSKLIVRNAFGNTNQKFPATRPDLAGESACGANRGTASDSPGRTLVRP